MDKQKAMVHEMKAAYDWACAGDVVRAKQHLEFALDYLHELEAAEQGLHLTGGSLPTSQTVSNPQPLVVSRADSTPPTRK